MKPHVSGARVDLWKIQTKFGMNLRTMVGDDSIGMPTYMGVYILYLCPILILFEQELNKLDFIGEEKDKEEIRKW
jgi:hypothetical protein